MRIVFISICFSLASALSFGQQKDTLIRKLDSLSQKTDSAGKQLNNTMEAAYNPQTILTFKTYFLLLGSNLKQSFTKPFHMTGKDWGKFGAFAAAAGALSLADETIQKEALRFRNRNPKVIKLGRFITNFGGISESYTLAALGAYGFLFKNQKLKTTTLLATQSYITGAIVESVIKTLSGRTRPNYYDPAMEAEPSFKGPFANVSKDFSGRRSNSSFPSGHATVAFAAATVFAMEYKSTVWVPIVSYTAASLISASRITENKHWTTDVFVGAMLGYLTGRQIVNNYHRYAKLKAPQQPKNTVSFNMLYNHSHMEPGIVYTFR
ncbi:MAG: phosphatase PAP2 family protein [Chitinophagaceae bacterium]